MIIDKKKMKRTNSLTDTSTPSDAPPSYASALNIPGSFDDAGPSRDHIRHSKSAPFFPSAGFSSSHGSRKLKSSRSKSTSWFSFGLSKAAKQMRSTVQELILDVIKQYPSQDFNAVFASCRDACASQNLEFSSVLQDPFMEDHSPVYWAIMKRPVGTKDASAMLVMAFLSHMSPILPSTIIEVRHACILNSDHVLLTQIKERFSPFAPLSGPEEIVLSNQGIQRPSGACDLVLVEEDRTDPTAFSVKFEILLFQLRMRVAKSVKVEFIARARMWYISFATANKGNWIICLGLSDHSPPTFVDSRLQILDSHSPRLPRSTPATPPVPSTPYQFSDPSIPSLWSRSPSLNLIPPPPQYPASRSSWAGSDKKMKGKALPTVTFRLQSGGRQLQPRSGSGSSPSGESHAGSKGVGMPYEISMPLEESSMGTSLQFDGCPYLDADGTLKATFDAKLVKNSKDAECIIC